MMLYTDGISDANNRQNEMLGLKGILSTKCRMANLPASRIHDELLKAVTKHENRLPPYDDMAVMAVRAVVNH